MKMDACLYVHTRNGKRDRFLKIPEFGISSFNPEIIQAFIYVYD